VTLLGVAVVLSQIAFALQPSTNGALPGVSISLPTDVPSETVRIFYFLTGPFGGSGGFVNPEQNIHAYRIEAAVKGIAASRIKTILYAPGCEIATFDDSLPGPSTVSEQFTCRKLPTVSLTGRIVPENAPRGKKPEVAISYLADWAHQFFGILDGAVTTIQIATAVPNAEGLFQVQLPDFGRDPTASSRPDRVGEFQFWLREAETGNPIGNLEPSDFKTGLGGLRIQSWYPQGLAFSLRKR
jgi:hypothetical protein